MVAGRNMGLALGTVTLTGEKYGTSSGDSHT